ncbi:MAG: hypothetical protein AAGI01_05770 [Myxococcota bacterium]
MNPRPSTSLSRLAALFMLCCTTLALTPERAWAGPWTKEPGRAYVKLSSLNFTSDTFVAPSGDRVQGTDFRARTAALYAEVGVFEGLHVQAFVPYVWATNTFNADTPGQTIYGNLGFGDTIVGVQWTPVKLRLPWAVRLDTKLPLYDVAGIDGPLASSFPVFGDGQVDLTGWLGLGGSIPGLPMYAFAEVGYRHRTELFAGEGNGRSFGDGVTFFSQVGYTFRDRVLVGASVNGIVPFDTSDGITQGFVTVGPCVAVRVVEQWRVEATYDPMLYARNNSPGPSLSLGVSYSR